jgi:hypothetical protein
MENKRLFKQIDNISIVLVNGFYVRNRFDVDFSNFGHMLTFAFIPENEIWIDNIYRKEETELFAWRAKREYDLMKSGKAYHEIIDQLRESERSLRLDFGKGPDQLRKKPITAVNNFMKVFLIDGFWVRNKYNVDFVEGGHGLIYGFIPEDEVWIDKYIDVNEQEYVIAHELIEKSLMTKDPSLSYGDAHEAANVVEQELRSKSA